MTTKHLTDEQILDIFNRARAKEKYKVIAKDYPGVTVENVSEIKSGKIWGYITGLKKAAPIEELTSGEPVSDIPFYDGYFITRSGIVISTRKGTNRVISTWSDNNGYIVVGVTIEKRQRTIGVHHLLCLAFKFDEYFNGAIVRHLDGNPKNNDLSNLKWGTYQENSNDMIRHNRSLRGSKSPKSVLTNKQVLEIKRLLADGKLRKAHIARQFNVPFSTIYSIYSGQSWSWLDQNGATS